MPNQVEVSKINIKIGKKEISLSLGEANELMELLNETFGKGETVYLPGSPIIYPYPSPYRTTWPNFWEITTGDSSSGSITYSAVSNKGKYNG